MDTDLVILLAIAERLCCYDVEYFVYAAQYEAGHCLAEVSRHDVDVKNVLPPAG